MSNESELASVVGHEIGHVTARHGASQMSKAQLANLGLTAGAVLAPEQAQRFGALAQTGLGLVFLKYGRDDERQADDLGLRYMIVGGYDPRPMAGMFDMLDRVGQASGASPVPGWMSTHPTPGNRRAHAESKIASMNRDFTGWTVGRDDFLRRLAGLTFGDDPRQGYFEGNRFNHPAMRFRIDFPQAWTTKNLREAVIGQSADKDAVLQLTLSSADTPEQALDTFFADSSFRRTGPSMGSISGLRTAGDGFYVETEQGALQGRVGFVAYGGRVFSLLAYSAQYRWDHYEPELRRALASFDKLEDPRALAVQPQRIEIVRADRAESLESLAARHHATAPVETLALINRMDPTDRVEPGRSYKLVTGGKIP